MSRIIEFLWSSDSPFTNEELIEFLGSQSNSKFFPEISGNTGANIENLFPDINFSKLRSDDLPKNFIDYYEKVKKDQTNFYALLILGVEAAFQKRILDPNQPSSEEDMSIY